MTHQSELRRMLADGAAQLLAQTLAAETAAAAAHNTLAGKRADAALVPAAAQPDTHGTPGDVPVGTGPGPRP